MCSVKITVFLRKMFHPWHDFGSWVSTTNNQDLCTSHNKLCVPCSCGQKGHVSPCSLYRTQLVPWQVFQESIINCISLLFQKFQDKISINNLVVFKIRLHGPHWAPDVSLCRRFGCLLHGDIKFSHQLREYQNWKSKYKLLKKTPY